VETILDVLEVKPVVKDSEYNAKLVKCGFQSLASDFPSVTPQAIRRFLVGEAKKSCPRAKILDGSEKEVQYLDKASLLLESLVFVVPFVVSASLTFVSSWFWLSTIPLGLLAIAFVGSVLSNSDTLADKVVWDEQPIDSCKMTPPIHVLDSILREKSKFSYLRIVTVKNIKDPLVVGINEGDSNRYLIDWWDTDIDPSELV